MTKLDDMIEQALRGEDGDILRATEEQGYLALVFSQFRGRLGWIVWVIMIVQITMFLAAVWCGLRFFTATEVLPALRWGLSGAVLAIFSLNLKLSLQPQIHATRILREMKRLELMLASREAR